MTLNDLLNNHALITAIAGWCSAEVVKFFIHGLINHEWDITRLWGDGGMPSAHSATVTSLAVAIGINYGLDSGIFALAAIFAIVVMHDAMGVRLETGKQATLLNDIMEWFVDFEKAFQEHGSKSLAEYGKSLSNPQKLKEFVGHTPLQVYAGAITGFCIGIVLNLYIW